MTKPAHKDKPAHTCDIVRGPCQKFDETNQAIQREAVTPIQQCNRR